MNQLIIEQILGRREIPIVRLQMGVKIQKVPYKHVLPTGSFHDVYDMMPELFDNMVDVKTHIYNYLLPQRENVYGIGVNSTLFNQIDYQYRVNRSSECAQHAVYYAWCHRPDTAIMPNGPIIPYELFRDKYNPMLWNLVDILRWFRSYKLLFKGVTYVVATEGQSIQSDVMLPVFEAHDNGFCKFAHLTLLGFSRGYHIVDFGSPAEIHDLLFGTTIDDLKAQSESNTLTLTSWNQHPNIEIKQVPHYMSRVLSCWYNKPKQLKWILANNLLLTCNEIPEVDHTFCNPWTTFYILPELVVRTPLNHQMLKAILNNALIKAKSQDVTNDELLFTTLYDELTHPLCTFDWMKMINDDFYDDIFPDIRSPDIVHPYVTWWSELTQTPAMNFCYKTWHMADCKMFVMDNPWLFPKKTQKYFLKIMTDENMLWLPWLRLHTHKWVIKDAHWEDLYEYRNDFFIAELSHKLQMPVDEFWDTLSDCKKLLCSMWYSNIRHNSLCRLENYFTIKLGNTFGSISLLSKTEKQQLWIECQKFVNLFPVNMIDAINDLWMLNALDYDDPIDQRKVTTIFKNAESFLYDVSLWSQSKQEYILDLLAVKHIMAGLSVVESGIVKDPPIQSLIKELESVPELKVIAERVLFHVNSLSSASHRHGFNLMLKITGQLFEWFMSKSLDLSLNAFDYDIGDILNDLSIVQTQTYFTPSCPLPSVDLILDDPVVFIELIYANNNLEHQRDKAIAKFERLKTECELHGFTMPNYEVVATSTVDEWPTLLSNLSLRYNIKINKISLNFSRIESLLKQCKAGCFSLLTHDQQQEFVSSLSLAHQWNTKIKIPADDIDEDKLINKMLCMCKREQEMYDLDSSGMHVDQLGPNYLNMVSLLSWKGPFSNENEESLTRWDEEFIDTLNDKFQRLMISGLTNECMNCNQLTTINGESVALFFCTGHNETESEQLTRLTATRYATILERIKLAEMHISPNNYGSRLANSILTHAHTSNLVDDRVDYLVKIPTGIFQNDKFVITSLLGVANLPEMSKTELCRKLAFPSDKKTQFANLFRKQQQALSINSGLPMTVYDASHCCMCMKLIDLVQLNDALVSDDERKFNNIIQAHKQNVEKLQIATYDNGSLEHSATPELLANELAATKFYNDNNIFNKAKQHKMFWHVVTEAIKKFDKYQFATAYERRQMIVKRKIDNEHTHKFDPHFPQIASRIKMIDDQLKYLGSKSPFTSIQRNHAKQMMVDSKLVDDAKKYMRMQNIPIPEIFGILDVVLSKLCERPGFLYAVHCMDVAEQVRHLVSTKTGDGNIGIRTCELTNMELVIHIHNEVDNWDCKCVLVSHEQPIQNFVGPAVTSTNAQTWSLIPNTTSWMSYPFKITDLHVEQYCALPAYVLDNVITEMQLQNLFTKPNIYESDLLERIIYNNTSIWMVEAARMNKLEGSLFLSPRYILMNVFSICAYDKLDEKVAHIPKTSFEHWVLNKLATQLPKFDTICAKRDIYAAGTVKILNKILTQSTLDVDELITLSDDLDVWDLPLFFSDDVSNSAAMSIFEVFKGYQQSRHELDTRTAKLTVGNKIQETVHKVFTKRKNNSVSCQGNPYELWGLRGYTSTLYDGKSPNLCDITVDVVKELLDQPPSIRNIDQETNLALFLATNQLSLPSCCATMITIGSKMLNNEFFDSPHDVLKKIRFDESETDMIKTTSRNHLPLVKVPSLIKMRDQAAAIKCTKLLRLVKIEDESDAKALLNEMSIDTSGPMTTKILSQIYLDQKHRLTPQYKIYLEDLLNDIEVKLDMDDKLMFCHTLNREKFDKTILKPMIEKKILHVTTFTPTTITNLPTMIDEFADFILTKPDQVNLGLLLMIWFSIDNASLNLPKTHNDRIKYLDEQLPTGLPRWEQTFIEQCSHDFNITSSEAAMLTVSMYTHLSPHEQMKICKDERADLSLNLKIVTHILPVIVNKRCINSLNIKILFHIPYLNKKTILRRTRRSEGINTHRLPTSKRMNKGISIATSMLSDTLLKPGRYKTKLDRALESLYSDAIMTFGRSFKEQLEKPRELPIKDVVADTKTDFVERVCQSALSRVIVDAVANPKLKKRIQQEMASKVFQSLRGIKPDQKFVLTTNQNEKFSQLTWQIWHVILGLLDHSAWGPNHAPYFFAWQFACRHKSFGQLIAVICSMFCFEGSQKDDEIFPEMWHAWVDKNFKRELLPDHVKQLYDYFMKHMRASRPNAFDMGQGMFHVTSSDNSQCVCKMRQSLLMNFANELGLKLTVRDQQGSDDRHASWDFKPSNNPSKLSKEMCERLIADYESICNDVKPTERTFTCSLQKALYSLVIAADSMISKCMNYSLSPKSANGLMSEMNSAFEHASREVNPLVRETAPISKMQPIGSLFESELHLMQLCRSGYVCGSTELTILSLYLHKETRMRKFYQMDQCTVHNILNMAHGSRFSSFLIPLNLGGAVLPLINDLTCGSMQQIEEQKLNTLMEMESQAASLLLKAEDHLYEHIQTSLPDETNQLDWGSEAIPRGKFVRRGIKQRFASNMLIELLQQNKSLHFSALDAANKQDSLLMKLDVLTQGCTPTSSKVGEMQRLEQMLKQNMTKHANPTIGTKLRDAARAARSSSFELPIDIKHPSHADWLQNLTCVPTGININAVQSNIIESTKMLCTQHEFHLAWILKAVTETPKLQLKMQEDEDSLFHCARKLRQRMQFDYKIIQPALSTSHIQNDNKRTKLFNSPIKLLLQIAYPSLLTYKGLQISDSANWLYDKQLMESICDSEIRAFKDLIETLEITDITNEHINAFNTIAINTWQKTKKYMTESIDIAINTPHLNLEKISQNKKMELLIRNSLIRGRSYSLNKVHESESVSMLELTDRIQTQHEFCQNLLQMSCHLKMDPMALIRTVGVVDAQADAHSKINLKKRLIPVKLPPNSHPDLKRMKHEIDIMFNILVGSKAVPLTIVGENPVHDCNFVELDDDFTFSGTAMCNNTKVYVTSSKTHSAWKVVNPDQFNMMHCINTLNKQLNKHKTQTRTALLQTLLAPELCNCEGAHELIINPYNPTLAPTKNQQRSIKYNVISEMITPVYTTTKLDDFSYHLNQKSWTIEAHRLEVCQNATLRVDEFNMSVDNLNKELKRIAEDCTQPSKLLNYLIATTKPGETVVKKYKIMQLTQKADVSDYVDLLRRVTANPVMNMDREYVDLIHLCCSLSKLDYVPDIVQELNKYTWTDDLLDDYKQQSEIVFPSKNKVMPIIQTGPGAFEEQIDRDWRDRMTPLVTKLLLTVNPEVETSLKFLEDWEHGDLTPFIIEEEVPYVPTMTQMSLIELTYMFAPNKQLPIQTIKTFLVLKPLVTIINQFVSDNAGIPQIIKYVSLFCALWNTKSDTRDWKTLVLIVLRAIINSYNAEMYKTENVEASKNGTMYCFDHPAATVIMDIRSQAITCSEGQSLVDYYTKKLQNTNKARPRVTLPGTWVSLN